MEDAPAPQPSSSPRAPLPPMEDAGESFEWGALLDFSIEDDDSFLLSWPTSPPPPSPIPPSADPAPTEAAPPPERRIRKRDPRMLCSNFLAGRVPCACPEVDEKEGQEDEEVAVGLAGGRKRARMGGAATVVRCQVPGCEADIRELKGYHRRHRVCLNCAHAPSVVLDEEAKRYCQQCGKFHILPDFDEGKRSCRRKLERHNKRRRRRPTDSRVIMENEKENQEELLQDANCDEQRREMMNGSSTEAVETVLSNKASNLETLQSQNDHGSPVHSVPSLQNTQGNSTITYAASDETNMEERMDGPKSALSSAFCDKKSAYSSVCPTGRISFKLYDWNPAEFPRRLRHQIFQWLASMPVELEGYIRPGCTILTVFIAMPQFMWEQLSQDVALYVRDLVNAPESLFSGRGKMLIHLSNMIVQVMKDGTLLMNTKMEVQVPRLHYVHPTYFEAGKPMEFVACGSHLDQPKFRFLVSFAGKYLDYDCCCAMSHEMIRLHKENAKDSLHIHDHEMFRINITCTEPDVFGPAFIEVENESGLSNFIPVLFGNKHVCTEFARMQEAFDKSSNGGNDMSQAAINSGKLGLCGSFTSKQTGMSEILLDIAWLLKEPRVKRNEAAFSSANIQRLNCLLEFLITNDFIGILEEVLDYVDYIIGGEVFEESIDLAYAANFSLLLKYVNYARYTLSHRAETDRGSDLGSRKLIKGLLVPHEQSKNKIICSMPSTIQDWKTRNKDNSNPAEFSGNSDENVPLVSREIVHRRCCSPHLGVKWPRESWGNIFPRTVTSTRLTMLIMVSVVACFGACIVLLHPQKAAGVAVSLRRCLSRGSGSSCV